MRVATTEFGNVANIQRNKRDVVVQLRTTQLNVSGAVGSAAANVRTPGGVGRKGRFAGAIEKDEALHEFRARGGSELCKGLHVARSEEFLKGSFVVRARGC